MRAYALCFGLLTLASCAQPAPPDRTFAIFFTQESTAIDPAAAGVVAQAAAAAKQFPKLPVNVAGYADRTITPAAIITLSQARADAVAALLIADGVPADSIKRAARGTPPDSQPGVESRRVEIDIGDE